MGIDWCPNDCWWQEKLLCSECPDEVKNLRAAKILAGQILFVLKNSTLKHNFLTKSVSIVL